jgi:putative heme-binding domain-containing protein
LLSHPNAWWRTTAQRLILERFDQAAIGPLRQLCAASGQPLGRVHAAWLLESFGALEGDEVARLLKDRHARVREQGVLLAEPRLGTTPALREILLALASDDDARVRFQVALSLGAWDDDRILPALARIALAGAEDRWTRAAVATAVPGRAGALIGTLLRMDDGFLARPNAGRLALLHDLAALVGARRDTREVLDTLDALLALAGPDALAWQTAGLNGIADGMGRRGGQLGAFLKMEAGSRPRTAARTAELLDQAAALAADSRCDVADRLGAVRSLAHAAWPAAEPVLMRLITSDPAQEIRLGAVRALAAHPHADVSATLMKPWKGYTPAVRREVTEAMLRQPERIRYFLHEIEAGHVKPGDLDAVRTRQLLNHRVADIRDLARKLLQENLPAERKQVLESYKAALSTAANAERGRAVFQKNCATCHRVGGIGVDVGPDIADTRTKTPDVLLADILNPNQAIDNNYLNYVVTTRSGKVLTGVIAVETASSLTLRRAENQSDVVLRQDVEEIQSTGISLMPEGLEKTVSVQEMADLIRFLKDWRYLDGSVPVGDPGKAGPP